MLYSLDVTIKIIEHKARAIKTTQIDEAHQDLSNCASYKEWWPLSPIDPPFHFKKVSDNYINKKQLTILYSYNQL